MNNLEERSYLEEKHELAFSALAELDRIFKENNIEYFLLAGSVLGAVRHGGFIPWDDDIDIGIYYRDRERACEALCRGLSETYRYVDRSVDPTFPRLYGKILADKAGCVDVFLLVKTSNKEVQRKIQWASRKVLFKLYKAKLGYSNANENRSVTEKCKVAAARAVSLPFSKKMVEKLIERNESRFESTPGQRYYLNLYSAYSLNKEMIAAKWLQPAGEVLFNGLAFPTVNDTDAYLRHLYGNYRKLPPREKRHPGHEEEF